MSAPADWSRLAAVAGVLLAAAAVQAQRPARAPVPARAATAVVAGRAVFAGSGDPVPFSLIRLLPLAGKDSALAALTGADGTFRFDSVRAGEYRPRLDRVGYEPEPQPPIRVTGARLASLLIRSEPRALPPLAALPADTVCRDPAEAERVPALARLWQQLTTAAEARRLFDRAYTYAVKTRGYDWQATAARRLRSPEQDADVVHTPLQAFELELRASSQYAVWGTIGPAGFRLVVPDLPQILAPGFLETHCLLAVGDSAGRPGVRFLPNQTLPAYMQVRVGATILFDPSYAVERMNLEFLADGRPFVVGGQSLADVGFPGGQLRFLRRLDLEEIPRLAVPGAARWLGRTRYDNYRIVADSAGR